MRCCFPDDASARDHVSHQADNHRVMHALNELVLSNKCLLKPLIRIETELYQGTRSSILYRNIIPPLPD
jgi:hypothetical protein